MALTQAAALPAGGDIEVMAAEATPARTTAVTAQGDQTRDALLTGAILPTLLKLALQTVTVLMAQTAVNIAEGWYVGFLGTDALAGGALVFPVFMMMTMMSNGGVGGGGGLCVGAGGGCRPQGGPRRTGVSFRNPRHHCRCDLHRWSHPRRPRALQRARRQ